MSVLAMDEAMTVGWKGERWMEQVGIISALNFSLMWIHALQS